MSERVNNGKIYVTKKKQNRTSLSAHGGRLDVIKVTAALMHQFVPPTWLVMTSHLVSNRVSRYPGHLEIPRSSRDPKDALAIVPFIKIIIRPLVLMQMPVFIARGWRICPVVLKSFRIFYVCARSLHIFSIRFAYFWVRFIFARLNVCGIRENYCLHLGTG